MDRRTLIAAAAAGTAASLFSRARATPREIMGLGWYVVFSPPSLMDRSTDFYGRTLGLPLMMTMRTKEHNIEGIVGWSRSPIRADSPHSHSIVPGGLDVTS
jgi:hypothetical protein